MTKHKWKTLSQIKVTEEVHKKIIRDSSRFKMSITEYLRYIVDEFYKYKITPAERQLIMSFRKMVKDGYKDK